MDFSTFKTADWLVIGGAMASSPASRRFDAGPLSPNAFDFTFTGLIPWLLLVAAAVLGFLVAGELIPARPGGVGAGHPRAQGVGALLILVRLLIGADLSDIVDLAGIPDQDLSGAGGLWVAAIGLCVAAAGGVIKFQAEGGRFSGHRPAASARRLQVLNARRPLPDQRCWTMSAIDSPASVGLRPIRTPAASSASIFPFAVPLPPDTIARHGPSCGRAERSPRRCRRSSAWTRST